MPIRAKEILDQLVRAEFHTWVVKREDGNTESFDPLTLITSFFESEIDIDSATSLFDLVVERLSARGEQGALTHQIIQSAVADCLLEFPHPKSLIWLANYDNMFGPDVEELSSQPGYVNVRNKPELKQSLLQIVAQLYGRTPVDVSRDLGNAELDAIVNRIVRIVRHSGFYVVKQEFLEALVCELASSSTWAFLPSSCMKDEDLQRALDKAEDWVILARAAPFGSVEQRRVLTIGLEEFGAAFLQKYGHLPHRTSVTSFQKFVEIVRTIQRLLTGSKAQQTLPQIVKMKIDMEQALGKHGIAITSFIEQCQLLAIDYDRKFNQRACDEVLALIGTVRSVFFPNKQLDEMRTLGVQTQTTGHYLALAALVFASANIRASLNSVHDRLDVDLDFGFHEVLEYGRRLAIRYHLVDESGTSAKHLLARTTEDITLLRDTVPVLVLSDDIDENTQKELATLATRYHRLICLISRSAFERTLRAPKDIRNEILRLGEKFTPEARLWRANVFAPTGSRLPPSLRDYERGALQEAMKWIEQGHGAEACRSSAVLQEANMRETVLLLASVTRSGFARQESVLHTPQEPQKSGIGAYLNWLRELARECESNAEFRKRFAPLLPSARLLDRYEELREARNGYMHMDREISQAEARTYVREVTSSVAALHDQLAQCERAVVVSAAGDRCYLFVMRGGGTLLTIPLSDNANLRRGTCLYLTHTAVLRPLIPAFGVCDACNTVTPLVRCDPGGKFTCTSCGHNSGYEQLWHKLVKELVRYEERVRAGKVIDQAQRQETLSVMKQTSGEASSRIRPWLFGIGEAVAAAAGPLGAPLKGLVKVRDEQRTAIVNAKISEAIEEHQKVSAALFSEVITVRQEITELHSILSELMAEYVNYLMETSGTNAEAFDKMQDTQAWPFVSVSRVTEKSLANELCNVYGHDMELFFTHVSLCGHDTSRLKRTGTPQVDTYVFVRSLRGQPASVVRQVLTGLLNHQPGCTSLREVVADLGSVVDGLQRNAGV